MVLLSKDLNKVVLLGHLVDMLAVFLMHKEFVVTGFADFTFPRHYLTGGNHGLRGRIHHGISP